MSKSPKIPYKFCKTDYRFTDLIPILSNLARSNWRILVSIMFWKIKSKKKKNCYHVNSALGQGVLFINGRKITGLIKQKRRISTFS